MHHCTLSIAISAVGTQLSDIRLPAPSGGVDYLVILQTPDNVEIPTQLDRPDVSVVQSDMAGLSNSRNIGIESAKGELVLFTDYDIHHDLSAILHLSLQFRLEPDLDLAVGWKGLHPPQDRSHTPYQLNRFNCGHSCARSGIMVRKATIHAMGVRFDPRFGAGTKLAIGEDFIFVTDIIRLGGKAFCYPVHAGFHPNSSTGQDWKSSKIEQGRLAVLKRVYGAYSPLIKLAYAIKHRKKLRSPLRFALSRPPRF